MGLGAPAPVFSAGGFHYLPGVFQYSAGVAAAAGYRLQRTRFSEPIPLGEAFAMVEAFLEDIGRPTEAFCACELRSPAPFSEAGFFAFNTEYAGQLERWGLLADGVNPVARTNVCPVVDAPSEPSMYAFTFTLPEPDEPAMGSFVIAGSGESIEGKATYEETIVALGDTSPAGIATKAAFVLDEMERRLAGFGKTWADCSTVDLYTVFDAYPVLGTLFAERRAWGEGVAWHWCRPPVEQIDFEMDCRRIGIELLLEV